MHSKLTKKDQNHSHHIVKNLQYEQHIVMKK